MRFKNFGLGFALCLLAAAPVCMKADTLQLKGTPGSVVDNVYVYPYQFSVNGSSTLTSLMCINFKDEITMGEQWTVDIGGLTTAAERADAWIFSQLDSYSASDVQFAVWDILDSDVSSLSGFTSNSQLLVNEGLAAAGDPTLLADGYFNGFTLYTPDQDDQTGWGNTGLPQTFIGGDPSPAPEPSSLALLGTSVLGAAEALRRRAKLA